MNSYAPAPPCNTITINAYLTPEAARVLVNAYEELQKLGFEPQLNICLMPQPNVELPAADPLVANKRSCVVEAN